VENLAPPPGYDPRTFQPVVSRYTDYATPAPNNYGTVTFCWLTMPPGSVDRVPFTEISLVTQARKCQRRSPDAVALEMQCSVQSGATCTCNLKQQYHNDSQMSPGQL